MDSKATKMSGVSASAASGKPASHCQRHKKLEALLASLTDFGHSPSSHSSQKCQGTGHTPFIFSEHTLAEAVFARANVDFLEHKSVEELRNIVKRLAVCVHSLQDDPSSVQLDIDVQQSTTSVFLALTDRPFVVNTIMLGVQAIGAQILTFLHPIIALSDGRHISVSFLELDGISAESADLGRAFVPRLGDLVLATDDYHDMLDQAAKLVQACSSASGATNKIQPAQANEASQFVEWLIDEGYVFLGYARWSATTKDKVPPSAEDCLGILKESFSQRQALLNECADDISRMQSDQMLLVSKLKLVSPIHRSERLVHVVAAVANSETDSPVYHSLVGLLTSRAMAQEASSVPLVRGKLHEILEREQVVPNSHDYKSVVHIIDSMPKQAALIFDSTALIEEIHTIWSAKNRGDVRTLVRLDPGQRGAWVMVLLPSERYDDDLRRRLERYLCSLFKVTADSIDCQIVAHNEGQIRLYFYLPLQASHHTQSDITRISRELVGLCSDWQETLREALKQTFGKQGDKLWRRYRDAFPQAYQGNIPSQQCVSDIELLERLSPENSLQVSMSLDENDGSAILAVFSLGRQLTLSQALPVLENVGFEVLSEQSLVVRPTGAADVYLHRFSVKLRDPSATREYLLAVVAPGIQEVFSGAAENDSLNELMLLAGLNTSAISVLRAYLRLLWQMLKFGSRQMMRETLTRAPAGASQLWSIFAAKFDPARRVPIEERRLEIAAKLQAFRDWLRDVKDINHDRILRSLASLIEHTLRTNFFAQHSALALKIHSASLDMLPPMRPLFEVFVHSPQFEGVHLRSSKVARGGIRASDRTEDYRTEILGLMRTQKLKNALIVPSGAKGGFIVRDLPAERESAAAAIREAYRGFIRSLLSVTDNRVKDKVVHPSGMLVYDEDDPYLVVAADKGTATFSDTANQIAIKEFDFWLGDAFASGGSKGYDHKKLGITAGGAWQAVRNHFYSLGIDFERQAFSVIGIGDMSGDVFGNGLLLSRNIKLIAAFDHRHILLDPDPNTEESFKERERLFRLPQSSWNDYRRELLSPGGGIYGRNDKEILLSPQVRAALAVGVDVPDVISGEALTSLVLRAPADLLWNGGIGTFVKSRIESDMDVGDHSNDAVRINADELRVKAVAEGGNLGFTQRARIDYARRGGRINMDAIDNCAGVDLSDHEVNIKLLLNSLPNSAVLAANDRDKLLGDLTPAVVERVLTNARSQCQLLAISEIRSRRSIEYFRSLIRELTRRSYINRALVALPDEDELSARMRSKEGLTRPELAICLSAVKLWLQDQVLESKLPDQPAMREFLLHYFPDLVGQLYGSFIDRHPLRRYILATEITNRLADTAGIVFIHRLCAQHSVPESAAIEALMAAYFILKIGPLRASLEQLYTFDSYQRYLNYRSQLISAARETATWLLSAHMGSTPCSGLIEMYEPELDTMLAQLKTLLCGQLGQFYGEKLSSLEHDNLSPETAVRLAAHPFISVLLEMLWSARKVGVPAGIAVKAYSAIMQYLGLNILVRREQGIETRSKWEYEMLIQSYHDIRRGVSLLTTKLLRRAVSDEAAISACLEGNPLVERLRAAVLELNTKSPEVALVSVVAHQVRVVANHEH